MSFNYIIRYIKKAYRYIASTFVTAPITVKKLKRSSSDSDLVTKKKIKME